MNFVLQKQIERSRSGEDGSMVILFKKKLLLKKKALKNTWSTFRFPAKFS